MKKRNISLFIGLFLTISMVFINVPINDDPLKIKNDFTNIEAKASTTNSIGVSAGDILYYQFQKEYDIEEIDDEKGEKGALKVEITGNDSTYVYYDLFVPNKTGGPWDGVWIDAEWESHWYQDNFSYSIFNHSFVFSNTITDMTVENATQGHSQGCDGLIMDAFNSSNIYSEYSDVGSAWNTIYFNLNQDDNASKYVEITAYVNKTTGLMTYYEQYMNNETLILELASYNLASGHISHIPDTYGLLPGDTIDRFSPDMGGRDYIDGPVGEKHADYPDWLESNNHIGDAFDLGGYNVPGRWFELNTHADDDYYKFYAFNGDNIQAWVEYYEGANVRLHTLDNMDNVIDHTQGELTGYEMMYEEVSWTAAFEGWYYIKINGSSGYYDDKYNFGIRINSVDGPEFWPDRDDDRHHSMWTQETVEFVYYNPYTNEDVIVITTDAYDNPEMLNEHKFYTDPFKIKGRVNISDPTKAVGEGYFYKDLDFSNTAFQSWFTDMWLTGEFGTTLQPGLMMTYDTDWIEVKGQTTEGHDWYFFVQKLGNLGTVRYMHQWKYNESMEERGFTIAIDCSIPGEIVESDPKIGVSEGDWWQYLVEEQKEYYEDGPDGSHGDNRKGFHYANFTVTHIFAANKTVMGVIGKMQVYSINNDGDPVPEYHEELFQPFTVFDTAHPETFMTMGGHGRLEGPPVLLPKVADWGAYETAMLGMFDSMGEGPGTPEAYFFDDDTVRLRFRGNRQETINGEGGYWEQKEEHWSQDIVLDVNDNGMTTHLDQYSDNDYRWEDSEGGYYKKHQKDKIVAFMTESSQGEDYEPSISSVTGVSNGDQFIWERSEYREPGYWGTEDTGADPADKRYQKYDIMRIEGAADEYIVFLGARYWKDVGETSFHGDTWEWDSGSGPVSYNFWYLGSIRDDDLWTWMGSNIFDIGITDLAPLESNLLEMLNFAFEEGPTITSSDITFNGTSFEVSYEYTKDGEDLEQVMRWKMNAQGIMQDMFMGTRRVSDSEWVRWERTVLVETASPSAGNTYDVGEYFFDDIPDNYVPSIPPNGTTTDDDDPFSGIPGYPVVSVVAFSIIAVVALTIRKRK